ncbi:MAG: biliverdin-producing heme oxygenase, partial [Planctomycetota bacterium]
MADSRPLSQRLKEDNADLHGLAEHDAVPQHMVRGTMPREVYADYLGQMYLINRVLDGAISARLGSPGLLRTMVEPRQLQTPYLEADLAFLGVDAGGLEPLAGAARVIERIEAADRDTVLLGLHYVREGANNGNRFLAARLKGP